MAATARFRSSITVRRERALDVAFYEDSLRYDAFGAKFSSRRSFPGLHDRSVDPRTVGAVRPGRQNVTLSLLDDDHQFIASLPRMWGHRSIPGAGRRRGRSAPASALRAVCARVLCSLGVLGRLSALSRIRIGVPTAAATTSVSCRSKPMWPASSRARRCRTGAGRPRSARDGGPYLHGRQPRQASGGRIRPVRPDALPGDADPRRHRARLRHGGALLFAGRPRARVLQRVLRRPDREALERVAGRPDPPYLPSRDDDGCRGFPAWSAELSGRPAASAGGCRIHGHAARCAIASRNGSGRVASSRSKG